MTSLASPRMEDVVIYRRSPAAFTIGTRSGAPQIQCRTFEEALQRAGSFASGRQVRMWIVADQQQFVPLANDRLLRTIWSEYAEMPGLKLTPEQAQRLWAVDESTCTDLLESLVAAKLLVRGADRQYARFSHSSHSSQGVSDSPVQSRMAKAEIAPQGVESGPVKE